MTERKRPANLHDALAGWLTDEQAKPKPSHPWGDALAEQGRTIRERRNEQVKGSTK
jgi:hypothetical protein